MEEWPNLKLCNSGSALCDVEYFTIYKRKKNEINSFYFNVISRTQFGFYHFATFQRNMYAH